MSDLTLTAETPCRSCDQVMTPAVGISSAGVGVNQGTRFNVPQAAPVGATPMRQHPISRPAVPCVGATQSQFSPPSEAGRAELQELK